jgi:hypothetical protein
VHVAVPVSVPAEAVLGQRPDQAGAARRTRLALPPAVRAKLESIEQQVAGARAEVFRLTDLLAGERDEQQRLARIEATWKANYYRNVSKDDVEALRLDHAAADREIARLEGLRDAAQQRYQRLGALADGCRRYLGVEGARS